MICTWKLPPRALPLVLECLPGSPDQQSLDDVSAGLPGGAYTTFRTFNGDQALDLDGHLARLAETARLAGRPLEFSGEAARLAIRHALQAFPWPTGQAQDLRLRLTLDLQQEPGAVYISAEPLHVPPPEAYAHGVRVVTLELARNNPKAKLTEFISRASQTRQALPSGVHEAIMVNLESQLLEGLSSNFFAVLHRVLFTAEVGVLDGLTRRLVLECAAGLDLPVRRAAIHLADLPAVDEAFITSSSRGVLPVRQIDALILPAACPGAFTSQLSQAYDRAVAARLQTI